ncbi:MAG: hypothetical protein RIM99_19075 [Cyclobacteriaceae bacterium]
MKFLKLTDRNSYNEQILKELITSLFPMAEIEVRESNFLTGLTLEGLAHLKLENRTIDVLFIQRQSASWGLPGISRTQNIYIVLPVEEEVPNGFLLKKRAPSMAFDYSEKEYWVMKVPGFRKIKKRLDRILSDLAKGDSSLKGG